MKCGPKPSRAAVEEGASTQLRRKKELPIENLVRSASDKFAAGKENALRPVSNTVVSPPVNSAEEEAATGESTDAKTAPPSIPIDHAKTESDLNFITAWA
jgi:hypothetical protein